MDKHKYRLKGHESFILREGWLTKGIQAVQNDSKVFGTNAGADALGVGTNMAKAIRYWMRAAGITEESTAKGVFLTDFGKLLAKWDLYFEDIFSLWILHCNIACNFKMATSWNVFFNDMDITSAFSREDMDRMMERVILEKTGEEEISQRSLHDDCSAILSMYAEKKSAESDPEDKRESPFAELGLVSNVGKNKFIKRRPMMNKIDPLVILYLMIEPLNQNESMQIDFSTEGYNMPGKILNLNRILVNDFLDILQNQGYIIVNRTAGLDIIYPDACKKMTKMEVLKRHYERGITA